MSDDYKTRPNWNVITINQTDVDGLDADTEYNVCLNTQQIAVVSALLTYANWQSRWTDLTWTYDELQAFVADIQSRLNTLEECMACNKCYVEINTSIEIYNTNIVNINTWYQAYVTAGGVTITVVLVTDVPRMGYGHDSETELLYCYMAELWVNALCDGFLSTIGTAVSDVFQWVADIAGAAEKVFQSFTRLPLGTYVSMLGLGPQLAAGLARVAAQFFADGLTPDIIDALEDDEARREIVCCLSSWLAASPDVRPFAAWDSGVLAPATCGSLSDLGEDLRAFLRPIVRDETYYVMFYMSLDNNDLLGMTQYLPGCDCGDEWCYSFDFTEDAGGFTVMADQPWGEWVDGQGWTSTYDSGLDSERLSIQLEFPDANITYQKSNWIVTGSTTNPKEARQELYNDDVLVLAKANALYPVGTPFSLLDQPVDVTADTIELTINPGADRGPAGTLLICTATAYKGTGRCPFGIPNC